MLKVTWQMSRCEWVLAVVQQGFLREQVGSPAQDGAAAPSSATSSRGLGDTPAALPSPLRSSWSADSKIHLDLTRHGLLVLCWLLTRTEHNR